MNRINDDTRYALQTTLMELLTNALEHGNCNISYDEKSEWLNNGGNLLDLINGSLSVPVKYNFINGNVLLDVSDLPKAMKNTIKELEEYDQNNDPMFYECADMLYMMADRFLKDGAIDSSIRDKLIMKYPIA